MERRVTHRTRLKRPRSDFRRVGYDCQLCHFEFTARRSFAFLFTSSFLHFGYEHVRSPWAAEITWHHIGIPVALIVLLQDYRFLLLDTFVRFLVNFGLATAYIATILVLNRRFRLWDVIGSSTFLTGIALVTLCVSLIFFAQIRNVLQAWIGRVIFRRQNVNDCVRKIVRAAATTNSEEELLSRAAREVATHLG